MVEVTFSQGAAGSLRSAAGEGLLEPDMGHEAYCLALHLDVGRLEADVLGELRRRTLEEVHAGLTFGSEVTADMLGEAADALREIPARLKGAEPLRIWCSDAPDEMCALVWFMSWLSQLPARGRVRLVHLPAWLERPDGTIVMHTSCAELAPEDFPLLLSYQREAPALLLAGMHFDWEQLLVQDAELRAVISGHVLSVPADFYDFLIDTCLERMDEVFPEALLIGNVMGSSQLHLSDGWLALRIARLVEAGRLAVVEECQEKHAPSYHRTLRKARS